MKEKTADDDNGDVSVLPMKKRGRPVLLGEDLDRKLQIGVVSVRITITAAKGIVLSYNRSMLVEFRGHVRLNRSWAYSLLNRMQFVR